MNNLIVSWKETAKEKYGSINEGVRHLNNVCGTKITSSCINSMSKGERTVPASINRYMLLDVLPEEMKKTKTEINDVDLGLLFYRISVPERIK